MTRAEKVETVCAAVALGIIAFLAALFLGGCASDPIMKQNLQRAWQVWEEDRDPALPPSLLHARELERREALKYAEEN